MATLAIKGHPTRGREVIQLLEMLGGVNAFNLGGAMSNYYYYIDDNNNKIYHCLSINIEYGIIYTLEEFEEKFPYKVGDKVIYEDKIREITKIVWEKQTNTIAYKLDDKLYCNIINDLQPYEEENYCQVIGNDTSSSGVNTSASSINEKTMEENLTIQNIKNNNAEWLLNKLQEMSSEKAMQTINDLYDELHKPQYPKTYEECCKNVFGLVHEGMTVDLPMHYSPLLIAFTKLLICRDAYWKIAGKQMGLGKPWEPDWNNLSTTRAYIKINKGCFTYPSRVLVFPTAEMRDAFYENFKELIEQCKELL